MNEYNGRPPDVQMNPGAYSAQPNPQMNPGAYSAPPEIVPEDPKGKKKKTEGWYLLSSILRLLTEIASIAAICFLLITFVFGLYRNSGSDMMPSMQDGDLIFYYRLDKEYDLSDVVIAEMGGELRVLRVVAKGGDTVDIKDGGLYVNGWLQSESRITRETEAFKGGIDFPVTLEADELFLLGDARTNATDSRIYGPVSVSDTKGRVITVLRFRQI